MRNTEDHFQRAIEIGEKNQKTVELIRNWCANVSVKIWGGIGLVEAQKRITDRSPFSGVPACACFGYGGC